MPVLAYTVATVATVKGFLIGVGLAAAALSACRARRQQDAGR